MDRHSSTIPGMNTRFLNSVHLPNLSLRSDALIQSQSRFWNLPDMPRLATPYRDSKTIGA